MVKTGFINNPKFGFFARNFKILAERVDLDSVEKVFCFVVRIILNT